MAAQTAGSTGTIERLPTQELLLDAQNPRFPLGTEDPTQAEILKLLWEQFAVDEIALSIASNGYYEYEPLIAARDGDRLVVIEGNRRLAAVKLLLDATARKQAGATDLPRLTKAASSALGTLPVLVTSRDQIWQYLGFKHVNGPQAWQSNSKARYIAWVHNEVGVPLDDIATSIGDKHSTVKRLYRGLMVLDQAEATGVFSVEDRYKSHFSFSHLYTGLDYPGFQRHLGLSPERSYRPSPIRKAKLPHLGEVLEWLYGSRSKHQEPLIRSQNPDLRILDEVLQSSDGLTGLRRGLPLGISQKLAKGDERVLREALVGAKQNLIEANGVVSLGFKGERDLYSLCEDILQLAEDLDNEMVRYRRTARRRTARRIPVE